MISIIRKFREGKKRFEKKKQKRRGWGIGRGQTEVKRTE